MPPLWFYLNIFEIQNLHSKKNKKQTITFAPLPLGDFA